MFLVEYIHCQSLSRGLFLLPWVFREKGLLMNEFSCDDPNEKIEMLDAKIDALVERLWKSFEVLSSEEQHKLELELEEAKRERNILRATYFHIIPEIEDWIESKGQETLDS